jgi:hypothetical protein
LLGNGTATVPLLKKKMENKPENISEKENQTFFIPKLKFECVFKSCCKKYKKGKRCGRNRVTGFGQRAFGLRAKIFHPQQKHLKFCNRL